MDDVPHLIRSVTLSLELYQRLINSRRGLHEAGVVHEFPHLFHGAVILDAGILCIAHMLSIISSSYIVGLWKLIIAERASYLCFIFEKVR